MSEFISVALRDAIRGRAGFQCEYCLLPEAESFFPFEPDHFEFRDGLIVPKTDIGRVTEHLFILEIP